MRILYLITRSEHGGAQSHLLHLVRAAAQRGPVMVLTGEEGQFSAQIRSEGIETHALAHLKHNLHPWHDATGLGGDRAMDPPLRSRYRSCALR